MVRNSNYSTAVAQCLAYLKTKRKLFVRNISTKFPLCYLADLVPIIPLLWVPSLLPLYVALLLPPPGPEPLGGAHCWEVLLYHKEGCCRAPCSGINQEEATAPGVRLALVRFSRDCEL